MNAGNKIAITRSDSLRAIFLFGAAALVLQWSLMVVVALGERQEIISTARAQSAQGATALAAHVSESLNSVGEILAGVENAWLVSEAARTPFDPTLNEVLKRRVSANAVLADILVVDPRGVIINRTGPGPAPKIIDRDYVVAHTVHQHQGLFLGMPQASRVREGELFFGISRALRDGDGNLLLITVAIVRLGVFSELFEERAQTGSSVIVADHRGFVYVHWPNQREYAGQQMQAAVGQLLEQGSVFLEPQLVPSFTDGVERMTSVRIGTDVGFLHIYGVSAQSMWQTLDNFYLQLLLIGVFISAVIIGCARRIARGQQRTDELLASSQEHHALLEALINSIPDPISYKDTNGRYRGCNQAFAELVGKAPEEIVGKGDIHLFPPERALHLVEQGVSTSSLEGPQRSEHEYCYPDGRTVQFDLLQTPFYGPKRELLGSIDVARDVTLRKRSEDELLTLSRAVECSPSAVVITDADALIQYVNPQFEAVTGYLAEEVVGKAAGFLRSGETPAEIYQAMWETLGRDETWSGELLNKKKGGSLYWEEVSIAPIKVDGDLKHYVAIKTDISERKQHEREVWQLANYDQLTGLANRHLFHDRLAMTIDRSRRNQSIFALIYLDLDGFKPVNDQHGHAMGDELLQRVALRMLGVLRSHDAPARYGGDEFLIIIEGVDQRSIITVVEKVIAAISEPAELHGERVQVTASAGVAFYPDHGGDGDALIKAADKALYMAKADRNCRYVLAGDVDFPETA